MSVRALNFGVRRIAGLIEQLYREGEGAGGEPHDTSG